MRAHYERVLAEHRARAAALRPALFLPLGAADPAAGRRGVRAAPAGAGLAAGGHPPRRSTPSGPGGSSSGRSCRSPTSPTERPWDEPVDARAPDDPVEVLAAAHRRAHRAAGCDDGPRAAGRATAAADPAGRRDDPGAAARPTLRRDHPGAEAGAGAGGGRRRAARSAASWRSRTCSPALRVAATPRRRPVAGGASCAARSAASASDELFDLAHGARAALWAALRAAPPERCAGGAGAARRPAWRRPTSCGRSSCCSGC